MAKYALNDTAAIRQAFKLHDAQQRIANTKVGCALVVALMPAGSLLDYFVYHEQVVWPFLPLRLLSSGLAAIIWAFLFTELGRRSTPWLGVIVPLIPVVAIAGMIAREGGFASPYYAGLNLVLLAVGVVLHWSLLESIIAVLLVLFIYIAAGAWYALAHHEMPETRVLVNNFYFISLMDIMVIVGTYFQYNARAREFALRYELDNNRKKLEESNQKMMELDQIKSRFFANISHELRTPLTLLIAPLENLLHRFNLDAETKNLLATMHSNGMRLLKLINDLLDLVRLESGRLEVKYEPVQVAEFVKGLASSARQVAEDKRLRLETFVDPELGTVVGDHDKLEKIVLNLVFNALKFTPAGGRVELRAEKQGEEFVLTVSDTGMGISRKNLPFVFDRFWQADGSSKRKFQGVGIGLALVKELVEIQGGRVAVESEEGQGTTFTIRLPFKRAESSEQPAAAPETATPASATGNGTVSSEEWLANLYRRAELFPAMTPLQESMRPVETSRRDDLPTLLVADDEPDMLAFLKSQLSSRYHVLEAVDGQQAVEKAGQFLPDLILLDMMMPEKDGLQACRELRQHTPTQSIPIVLLTARADEETKLAALSAGASDFLAKPFSTTELHVRIKNLVESHHYQGKLSKQNQVLEATIEQLKETETQLVQSEKLASLGRMSAGIIHEINNPVNALVSGLFALKKKKSYFAPEKQGEYQEIVEDLEERTKWIQDIVGRMRMYTHPDAQSREQVEVSEIVEAAMFLLGHELKENDVEAIQNLTPHQTIWANKNVLTQVMVNLLQNSIDAMRVKKYEGEKPTIWIESKVENKQSILVVRDNGTGIEAEHLNKIFDPFFTTKDVGQGMGLGLAICYRIVQDFEGRIGVRTEPGKYCEFMLEFPAKG
jgi:signal transduction histidine kinase